MKTKCVVCKRKQGMKGYSFHKIPKNEKQRDLWFKSLEKENYKPTCNSIVCSNHFEPKCIERFFHRVKLKKGSVPTIFTEQSHVSAAHKPLLDENIIIEHERQGTSTVESLGSHIKIEENIIIKHERQETSTVGSHDSHIKIEENIIMEHEWQGTSTTERLNESHGSYIESLEILATPLIVCEESVQHDHGYTYTPRSFIQKFHEVQKQLQIVRNSERLLKQKVKRLKQRITSLRNVVTKLEKENLNSQEAVLASSILQDTSLELVDRTVVNVKKGVVSKEQYPPGLRASALTLHFDSPKACEYVRKAFKLVKNLQCSW